MNWSFREKKDEDLGLLFFLPENDQSSARFKDPKINLCLIQLTESIQELMKARFLKF